MKKKVENKKIAKDKSEPKTDAQDLRSKNAFPVVDVGDHRQAEMQRLLLPNIVDYSNDAIISKSLEGIITSWNQGAEKIFGYIADEAIGKHISMLIPPELLEEEKTIIGKIKKGQPVLHYETVRLTNAGNKINVSLTVSPIKDKDGKVIGASKIARNTTEQITAIKNIEDSEKRLQKTTAHFEIATSAAEVGTWSLDIATGNLEWSALHKKMWGYDELRTDLVYEDWHKVIFPGDKEIAFEEVAKALKNKTAYEASYRIKRADNGTIRWMQSSGKYFYNEAGQPIRLTGVSIDITAQKEAQSQLEYRKALLEAHNEASSDGILLMDTKGKILSYNKRFIEIWKMPQQIADAKDDEATFAYVMTQLVHPEQFIERVKYLYEHPTETSTDILEHKDGKIIERHGYPVVADDGSYYAWSWTFRDITEQRQAENRIRESERYFRYLNDTVPTIIWITEPDGYCSYLNRTWYEYTGQTENEGEGFGWLTATHPDDVEGAGKAFEEANAEQKPFIYLYRLKTKNGSYRWAKDSGSPRFNADGKYAGMIGTVVDVHEETIATRKIKETEERYHNLIYSSPSAIGILMGPELIITTGNEAIIQIWGKGPGIIGKSYFEALPELAEQGYREVFNQVYTTGIAFHAVETPVYINQDGITTLKYYNFILYPQRDEKGEVEGIGIIATEVTSQAELNKKIKESEEQFRSLTQSLPQLVWTTDKDGAADFFNQQWYDYTGSSPEQSFNNGWAQYIHPINLKNVLTAWQHSVATGESIMIETRLKAKDSSYKWFFVSGNPIKDEQGEILKWVGTLTNIDERKKWEEALRISENRYGTLTKASTSVVWAANAEGAFDTPQQSWQDYTGQLWGEHKGYGWVNMMHPDDQSEIRTLWQQALDQKETYKSSGRIWSNKYKDYRFFEARGVPLIGEDGKVLEWVGTITDVHEKKIAEEALKLNEEQFRLFADNNVNLAWIADGEGSIYWYNQRWYDYTGTVFEEMKGWGWEKVHHPEHKEKVIEFIRQAWKINKPWELTFPLQKHSGEYRWFLTRAFPVSDSEGKIIRWVGTNTDINDEKTLQEELKLNQKRRQDFIKMSSHELKTPITTIKGYVQLVLSMVKEGEEKLSPAIIHSSFLTIDKQVSRLTRLMTELLDLSRIESGYLELSKENFSMNELVNETVQDIVYTNIKHTINIIHDAECSFFGDRDRIGQVISNLLTNAVKYSPNADKIEVRIHKPADNQLAVSVKDYGIGIDKNDLEKVFERFFRAGGESEQTYPGFGVGLFVADEIVQRHGGNIVVESEKGKGSNFTFTLPL